MEKLEAITVRQDGMNTAAEHPGSLRRAEETPHFQGPHGHQHFRCSGRAPGWTSGPSREGVRDSQTGPVQMLHTTSANTLLLDSEPTPSPTQKWLKNQRSQVWAAVWPSQTSPWAVLGSGRGSLSAQVRKLTRTEESLKYAENQSWPAAVTNGSFKLQLKQTQPISRITRPDRNDSM